MKKLFSISFFAVVTLSAVEGSFGCKCKQKNSAATSASSTTQQPNSENPEYISAKGKISLQNKSACGAEIILIAEYDTLILIPIPALTGFEKDGEDVSFSYRKLKVHNPKGCAGIPVQVSDVKKK